MGGLFVQIFSSLKIIGKNTRVCIKIRRHSVTNREILQLSKRKNRRVILFHIFGNKHQENLEAKKNGAETKYGDCGRIKLSDKKEPDTTTYPNTGEGSCLSKY